MIPTLLNSQVPFEKCKWYESFSRELSSARDFRSFISKFPRVLCKEVGAKAVLLWAHDPVKRRLILVSSEGTENCVNSIVVDVPGTIVGMCADLKGASSAVDLSNLASENRRDADPKLTKTIGANWMNTCAVLNSTNPNQVLFVIDVRSTSSTEINQLELNQIGQYFGRAYESLLFEYCYRQSNLLRIELSTKIADGTLNDLYRVLTATIANTTDSDAAIVFVRPSSGELVPKGFDARNIGVIQDSFGEVLKVGEESAKTNREYIELQRDGETVKVSLVSVAIRDFAGQAVGSIVCVKRPKPGKHVNAVFTPDDATICETLGDVFAPFYELLSNEEDRVSALEKLGHELKGPVTGMKSAIAFAKHSIKHEPHHLNRYLGDLSSFTMVMTDMLADFELISEGRAAKLQLNLEAVDLVKDLLAPATRAIEESKEYSEVAKDIIRRPGLATAPLLRLDKVRMMQVVFNLLENAVKYSRVEEGRARVEITFTQRNGRYELTFRDWGIGVPPGFEYRIFSMGVRAPNVTGKSGKGFGLAISRGVARAHGGDIEYRRHPDGSEFVVILPLSAKVN